MVFLPLRLKMCPNKWEAALHVKKLLYQFCELDSVSINFDSDFKIIIIIELYSKLSQYINS